MIHRPIVVIFAVCVAVTVFAALLELMHYRNR